MQVKRGVDAALVCGGGAGFGEGDTLDGAASTTGGTGALWALAASAVVVVVSVAATGADGRVVTGASADAPAGVVVVDASPWGAATREVVGTGAVVDGAAACGAALRPARVGV